MKTYILAMAMLLGLGSSLDAQIVIGARCGGTYRAGGLPSSPLAFKVYTLHQYIDKKGKTQSYITCGPKIANPRPGSVNEPVASPVAETPGATTSYKFLPYPFTQLGGIQPALPAVDPVAVGNRDPSGGNDGFASEVLVDAETNTVLAPLRFGGTSGAISWPPNSIFDNLSYWNKPLAYSFQAIRNLIPSRWYPLNFFTVSDPTAKIPLVPVEISWAAVAGAAKYRFTLEASFNPLVANANLPQPISVEVTNPRTYTFTGRSSVTYSWSATPFDAAGNVITGEPVIGEPVIVFTQPSTTLPNGRYEYGWDAIPGAVRYEIQYGVAFGNIPAATPFTHLATFTENTITTTGAAGAPITQTTHVLGTINGTACTNCMLNANNDLKPQTPGFQYDFANGVLGQIGNGGNPKLTVKWRVRGIDAAGNVVRKSFVQSGEVAAPLPRTPYQTAHLSWPLVADATSYLVDVVENIADFERLPALTGTSVSNVAKQLPQARERMNSSASSASQPGETSAATSDVFLLRRVVPDYRATAYHDGYDAGIITVTRFKRMLTEARVYLGETHRAAGFYDDDPTQEALLDDQIRTATNNYRSFPQTVMDGYYPLISAELGLTVKTRKEKPTLLPNQIEIGTSSPITITDRSAGAANIVVAYANAKKTTTLTFTSNGAAGATGEYAFELSRLPYAPMSMKHALTFSLFGPVPVIENLNGKAFAEFNRLLPNQTYYWRVRALKDPGAASPGSTVAFTWLPWSAVSSFTTPTGVPVLVKAGPAMVNPNVTRLPASAAEQIKKTQ